MRFQYDLVSERTVKINDRFEFPENLDLSDFIEAENVEKDENRENCQYLLHAVLVRNPFRLMFSIKLILKSTFVKTTKFTLLVC
jgi:hypothetical protein